MRCSSTSSVVLAFVVAACGGQVAGDDEPDPSLGQSAEALGRPFEPPMLGVHFARGEAARNASSSVDMTWHNGSILTTSEVTAIFWGTKWNSSAFVGDKITGLDTFYAGYGGSDYAATNTEYTGTNGKVGSTSTYHGHVLDASSTGIKSNVRTSAILAEVCRRIASPVTNGYYPVYTDVPRGHNGYCAWHSYGTCSGVQVQFAFFFSLDGDAGCDPGDGSGLHSQGLAALANVSGHELSETVTDPRNGGWWDAGGNENADKCAWSWPSGAPQLVTFSNDSQWKIQGNWSNAAYDANTGFANRSGQNGCIF